MVSNIMSCRTHIKGKILDFTNEKKKMKRRGYKDRNAGGHRNEVHLFCHFMLLISMLGVLL